MTEQELGMLLGEINERTKSIAVRLDSCATNDRLNAVEDRADHAYKKAEDVHDEIVKHIDNHEAMSVNRNLILGSYLGALGAIAAALIALFSKRGGTP